MLAARPGAVKENTLAGRVVYCHDQLIFASLAYGGDGAISVRAQITPAVVVTLYDAAVAGNWPRARALQDSMRQLGPAIGAGWHPAIKGALAALGICGPDVAAPNVRWRDAELAAQRERLEAARRAGLFDPTSIDR